MRVFFKLEHCLHVSYYNLVLLKIPNKISNIHFFTEKFVGSSVNLTVPLEEGSFSILVVEYFSHGNQWTQLMSKH